MLRCFFVVLCALCAQSRLSPDVVPELYRLKLNLSSGLDGPSERFTGSVSITLDVKTDVKNFSLHALDVEILKTSLTYEVPIGNGISKIDVIHDLKLGNESIIISSGSIPRGRYIIDVNFQARFSSDLEGFYRTYYESQGKRRWMASTQFESQGARKVFPCFDEPSMRAKLLLELLVPPELHAVSNMPVSNTTNQNGLKRIEFAESPAMPTYLMAWFVGDSTFDVLYSAVVNGVTYGVHGRTDLKDQAYYAFNVTPKVIENLEKLTGIKYSSKMMTVDQVAIPDFSAAAMENWGLVTYRESYLMFDNDSSSALDKQHILTVISHELAHQWFGNAVTLDWWSSTWLNEGFARYLQYVISDKIEPSWMMNNQFLTDDVQLSMAADLEGHPLTNPDVTTKDEIEDMFDDITYGKGASILRMFHSILGDAAFEQWINSYLTQTIQSGGVAKPEDLFKSLSDLNLLEKFKPWTEISGHPVVIISSDRRNGSTTLHLSQGKENLTGSIHPMGLHIPIDVYTIRVINNTKTLIPVAIRKNYTNNSFTGEALHWLDNKTLEITLETEPDWYLIDMNRTGYYRVLYDRENWRSLKAAIAEGELPPLVRAKLVSDALNLVKTGYLHPSEGFDFVKFMVAETDLLVWKAALMAFKDIRDSLLGWKDARDELDAFVRYLIETNVTTEAAVSLHDGGLHYDQVLGMYVFKQVCIYHCEICSSLQTFSGSDPAPSEIIDRISDGALFCELARTNGDFWETLLNMYENSKVPTQKARYLNSLSCTENTTLQYRLLSYTLNQDIIKLQDVRSVITRVCDTENGVETVMKFIRDNGSEFVKRLSSMRIVRKILQTISNKLYTNGMIVEMNDVLSKTPVLGLSKQEQSNLISSAQKAAMNRQLVAKRICEGLGISCSPQQDSLSDPSDSDNDSATNVFLSFTLLFITLTTSLILELL